MSEVHLFLIWSNARAVEDEILSDIRSQFRVVDLVEVEWSSDAFAHNLACFYGADLPPGSDKETDSGTGPFLVCVIEDDRPRHRYRRVGRRLVRENRRVLEARARYRALAGGRYRVHASADHDEAERDLVLLFGRRPREFLTAGNGPTEPPRRHAADVLGSTGWRDADELLLALDVAGGARRRSSPAGIDIVVEVGDRWWAEQVLNGVPVGPGVWSVDVAGTPTTVMLTDRRRFRLTAPST